MIQMNGEGTSGESVCGHSERGSKRWGRVAVPEWIAGLQEGCMPS